MKNFFNDYGDDVISNSNTQNTSITGNDELDADNITFIDLNSNHSNDVNISHQHNLYDESNFQTFSENRTDINNDINTKNNLSGNNDYSFDNISNSDNNTHKSSRNNIRGNNVAYPSEDAGSSMDHRGLSSSHSKKRKKSKSSPISSLRNAVTTQSENWLHGFIIILLESLFSGIFVSAIMGEINVLIQRLGAFNKEYGVIIARLMSLPKIRAIFITFILCALLNLCMCGLIWIINKILHVKLSFRKDIVLVSTKASAMIPVIVISYILISVNPLLAVGVCGIYAIWRYIKLICLHGKYIQGRKKLLFIVLIIIGIFIYLKLTSFAIINTILLYLPDSVRHLFDNPIKLIGDIFNAVVSVDYKGIFNKIIDFINL